LIKAILALEHGEIPATLHFTAPNPRIDFASSPFYVCSKLQDWPASEIPRRAGVSSLVSAARTRMSCWRSTARDHPRDRFSQAGYGSLGETESALEEATNRLTEHLRANPEIR